MKSCAQRTAHAVDAHTSAIRAFVGATALSMGCFSDEVKQKSACTHLESLFGVFSFLPNAPLILTPAGMSCNATAKSTTMAHVRFSDQSIRLDCARVAVRVTVRVTERVIPPRENGVFMRCSTCRIVPWLRRCHFSLDGIWSSFGSCDGGGHATSQGRRYCCRKSWHGARVA